MVTALDSGSKAYETYKKAIEASAASTISFGASLQLAVPIIGAAIAITAGLYFGFEKLAEYMYDISDAAETLRREFEPITQRLEDIDSALDKMEEEFAEAQKSVDALAIIFVEGAEKIENSFFDVFTKETEGFQKDLLITADIVKDFLSGMEPSFESVSVLIQSFADEWDITWDQAQKIVMEAIKEMNKQMGSLQDSFFNLFTKESEEFQADLQGIGEAVHNEFSGMQPDFEAIQGLIQDFADRWGITWEDAEKIVMEKVEEIKATVGTIAPTLEEELINKAQSAMERFKECMGEKSTATKEETTQAMKDMVDSANELIANGLLGEAQALMDTFKEAEPDKMWTMVEDIDDAIESLTEEMNTEYDKMMAYADTFSGEERDLLIQRAEDMKAGYLTKIEELETMRGMILTRMKLETSGFMEDEIDTIMTGLLQIKNETGEKWSDIEAEFNKWFDDIRDDTSQFGTDTQNEIISALVDLKASSGMTWKEVTDVWNKCLDDAEGDVAKAIAAIQAEINSLEGKEVTVTTRYVSVYETIDKREELKEIRTTGAPTGPVPTTTTTGVTGAPKQEAGMPGRAKRQMGEWYVPYTGFLASLHCGEAILTVEQAERWRRGQTGRNVQIGPNYFSIASDMDIRETARKLARYVAQEERRLGLD